MIGVSKILINSSTVNVPLDFCGNHFKSTSSVSTEQARNIVSHDMAGCRWFNINTSNGVYNWSSLDDAISRFGSNPVTYCMFGTPNWASARPAEVHPYGNGVAAEPSNMAYLTSFVTALLNRYPTISEIEVWNEPDVPTSETYYWFSGSVSTFVTMASTIYAAAKAVRSTIKVIGPSSVNYLSNPNWLDSFYTAGGDAYIDAISLHAYQRQWGTPHKALLGIMHQVDYSNKARSKAGLSNKQIYITEMGQINPIPQNLSDDELINSYFCSMVVAAAKGVRKAAWYQFDDATFGYSSRPNVVNAVKNIINLLSGATLQNVSLCSETDNVYVEATINGTYYKIDKNIVV